MMKKFLILLIIPFLGFSQVNAQTQSAAPVSQAPGATPVNPNAPVAKWDKLINDFGEIAQNIPKTADFTLTNDGKEPLVITSAKASCGCTNLEYPKKPILPGKSGVITATYNAAAPGVFLKTITVITNADPNPVILQIKGSVKQ